VIEPAPPYRGEGPRALWHVSEDATIERFEPHLRPEHAADEPLVWAIDTRHLPLYWFPRDCPRASFWANSATVDEDVERFLGGDRSRRVHVIESVWLDRMRETPVFAYRMPEESFDAWDRFWARLQQLSRSSSSSSATYWHATRMRASSCESRRSCSGSGKT